MAAYSTSSSTTASDPSIALVFVYWLVAVVPLAWGVYQTVQKSIPLFHVTGTPIAGAAHPITPVVSPTTTLSPTVTATPVTTPLPETSALPAATPISMPAESPFSTAQPSATVGPITTPVPPAN